MIDAIMEVLNDSGVLGVTMTVLTGTATLTHFNPTDKTLKMSQGGKEDLL